MNFSQIISNDDDMFQGNLNHYFQVGEQMFNYVKMAQDIGKFESPIILDLPSGFGRLMRFLSAYYPVQNLYACDITRSAIDFCSNQYFVNVHQAMYNDFKYSHYTDCTFDIIACGSLLTHISESNAEILVSSLIAKLKQNGILVISCHGKKFIENIKSNSYGYNVPAAGFPAAYTNNDYFYEPYPNSVDGNYGISFTPKKWFLDLPGVEIVDFFESGWDNHQDVFLLRKA